MQLIVRNLLKIHLFFVKKFLKNFFIYQKAKKDTRFLQRMSSY